MRWFFRALGFALSMLLLVGVAKGVLAWNASTGGHGVAELLISAVNGVSDLTVAVLAFIVDAVRNAHG